MCMVSGMFTIYKLFCQISKLTTWLKFILSDTEFMNTCSFVIHVIKNSVCSKVFAKCIVLCFGEFKEASFFFF